MANKYGGSTKVPPNNTALTKPKKPTNKGSKALPLVKGKVPSDKTKMAVAKKGPTAKQLMGSRNLSKGGKC